MSDRPFRPASAVTRHASAGARLPRPARFETIILVVGFVMAVVSGITAYRAGGPYGERNREDPRVRRICDARTGRVVLIVYDADGDLRFDHWCYMDGERLLRMDVDSDRDRMVDRREFYAGERLEKTEYVDHGRVVRTEIAEDGQPTEAPR